MDFLVAHDLMMEGFDQETLFHFTEKVRAATYAVAEGVGFIPPQVLYNLLDNCPECTSEMADLLSLAKRSDFAMFHSEPVIPGHHTKRLTVEIVRPHTPSSTPSVPASSISDSDSTDVESRKINRKQNKRGDWVNESRDEYKKRMKRLHNISHKKSERFYNLFLERIVSPESLSLGAASPDMSNAMLSGASTSSSSSSNTVNSPPRPRL
jgi:hypothetical protein